MAFVVENREFIENAVRHAKNTINLSGRHGSESDAEVAEGNSSSHESGTSTLLGILKEDLITLTASQRIAFTIVMSLLLVISLCGNICTLHVNIRRQIRPFFRACLISLAISDMINTTFLTVAYLSQITIEFVQIWILDRCMCHLVPFITTAAILVSSMTLVGIAMDRYFAVMRAVISFWNPGVIFCVLSMLVLWTAAIGISWPVFGVYEILPVYILTLQEIPVPGIHNTTVAPTADIYMQEVVSVGSVNVTAATTTTEFGTTMPYDTFAEATTKIHWKQRATNNNHSYVLMITSEPVMMCISNQSSIAIYYFAIFAIIFVPTIIAFIWINTVIAKELWKRRHTPNTISKKQHNGRLQSWWRYLCCSCSRKSKNDERHLKEDPADAKERSSNCATISSGVDTVTDTRIKIPQLSNPSATSIEQFILPANTTRSVPTKGNNNNRTIRHIRMFSIIIMLITGFLFLRLPTWIFLLMRICGSYTGRTTIILHYCFGILNITSSVLNPFFYTFLTETIKCAHIIKGTFFCGVCRFRLRHQSKQHIATYPTESTVGFAKNGSSLEEPSPTCCGYWLHKMAALAQDLCCKSPTEKSSTVTDLGIQPLGDTMKCDSELYANEKDEGVDCSGESFNSNGDADKADSIK